MASPPFFFFSEPLFLYFSPSRLERRGGGGGGASSSPLSLASPPYLDTAAPSVSSPSCHLSTNELSLCGIESSLVTSVRILLFPNVCFVCFCLKTIKKHTFCLPCSSLASCRTSCPTHPPNPLTPPTYFEFLLTKNM